jgi:hypothetical protein
MNQAVAKSEPKDIQQATQVANESNAVIAMIERAARDPAVDIDKFERLMAMKERQEARAKEDAFNDAMALAQSEMRPVAADATNPQTRSKYATYAALDRPLRSIYTKHGFSISYNTEDGAPAEHVRVVAYVSCKGHTRRYHADMPSDGKGAKGGDVMTKTHATGSAMSYGQRYLLKLIFNIAVGPDDDGNAASSEPINAEQAEAVKALIVSVGADIQKFLKVFKIERVEDLPTKRFEEAKMRLEQFGKQQR